MQCPTTSSAIRRRSLAVTPGTATRNPIPSVRQELAIRKEKARHSVPHAPLWMREKSLPSLPACLSTLAPPSFQNNTPSTRAETPADLDYTHLGTLKLGSLVLTNGHASPDPNSTAERCDYSSSDEEAADSTNEPTVSSSVSMSQKVLHRKTWSAGVFDSSFTAQTQDDSADPGTGNRPDAKDDQHQITFSVEEAKDSMSTLLDGSTGFNSKYPPIVGSPDTLISPRTVIHNNKRECVSLVQDTDLHYDEQKLTEDEVEISEEEAKSFRNEALRILECTTLTPEQQEQPSGECSSRPSTNSESSSKQPIEPIQAKSDSGYCSEYSMAAFSRNSSAKSRESRSNEESVRLSPASQSLDKPKKVDLLKDLAAERVKQQATLPNVPARRKSSGFLRLRANPSREISRSSQTFVDLPNLEIQTEKSLKARRSTEHILGPRKLQKKNPALHQSFIIVSNTGRSPLSSSNSSVDNLQRFSQKNPKKSQQIILPANDNLRNGEKSISKREQSILRRSFLRSKSTTNINESGLNHLSNLQTDTVSNTNISHSCERKKSLDLSSKRMKQQSKREDADLGYSQSRIASDNTDYSSSKHAAHTSSLRPVQSEKVPSRSKSAAEIKPFVKLDFTTPSPRPDLQPRSLSVQPVSANDAENPTSGETRDHRFAPDVPPVPSIPTLSSQKSSSSGLKLRNEGLLTAKVAQSITPLIINPNQGVAGQKVLVAKRSRDELARFIAHASKQPPSPSKRRFYKEVREHQEESRRSLGDGPAFDQRSLKSRKSFGSVSDKWPRRSNHSDLPISLRA